MSDYGFFLDRARQAAGLVSRLEASLAKSPGDRSVRLTLASAISMAERTERELYEIAAAEQVDLCRYRLVRHSGLGFGVHSVSKSLELFQDAVSFVYHAVTGQPRVKIGQAMRRETELLFGYSFAGSLGVVLLAPSERGLFFNKFDDVVRTINQVFEIKDNSELRDAAKAIGPAAIQKIYNWSAVNYESGYDLDLRWTNSNSIEFGSYVEAKQFGRLADLISLTSNVETTAIRARGILVGFDSVLKTFHLVETDGDSYKGNLENGFPENRDWTVNRRYEATISAEVTTRFSTGEETRRFRLVGLVQADGV